MADYVLKFTQGANLHMSFLRLMRIRRSSTMTTKIDNCFCDSKGSVCSLSHRINPGHASSRIAFLSLAALEFVVAILVNPGQPCLSVLLTGQCPAGQLAAAPFLQEFLLLAPLSCVPYCCCLALLQVLGPLPLFGL